MDNLPEFDRLGLSDFDRFVLFGDERTATYRGLLDAPLRLERYLGDLAGPEPIHPGHMTRQRRRAAERAARKGQA